MVGDAVGGPGAVGLDDGAAVAHGCKYDGIRAGGQVGYLR
nr:MAG TPA: hypothetical protein [Caudoviricetes sp.]